MGLHAFRRRHKLMAEERAAAEMAEEIICDVCNANPCVCVAPCEVCGQTPCICTVPCEKCGETPCICKPETDVEKNKCKVCDSVIEDDDGNTIPCTCGAVTVSICDVCNANPCVCPLCEKCNERPCNCPAAEMTADEIAQAESEATLQAERELAEKYAKRREELDKTMSVPKLQQYAKDNKIPLGGATRKADIIEAIIAFEQRGG